MVFHRSVSEELLAQSDKHFLARLATRERQVQMALEIFPEVHDIRVARRIIRLECVLHYFETRGRDVTEGHW